MHVIVHVHVHVHVYLYVHVCVHVYLYVHVYVHVYLYMYICVCTCIFVCTCTCIFVCTYKYTCTCTCIFVCTCMHAHTAHLMPPCSNVYVTGYQEVDLFTEIRGKPQPDFDSVFGSSGGPQGPTPPQGSPSKSLLGGEILTPEAVGVHASMQHSQPAENTGLTTDVESSLARAAENLCTCVCVCVCVHTDICVRLSVCPSGYLPVSISISVCLSYVCLSVCPSVCPSLMMHSFSSSTDPGN